MWEAKRQVGRLILAAAAAWAAAPLPGQSLEEELGLEAASDSSGAWDRARPCLGCQGERQVTCGECGCSGKGNLQCPQCSGLTRVDCSICEGGLRTCPYC